MFGALGRATDPFVTAEDVSGDPCAAIKRYHLTNHFICSRNKLHGAPTIALQIGPLLAVISMGSPVLSLPESFPFFTFESELETLALGISHVLSATRAWTRGSNWCDITCRHTHTHTHTHMG